jgi:hypothetical protein
MLTKAGQGSTSDLTDQDGTVVASTTEAKPIISPTTTSTSQPSYSPAVGDVVEDDEDIGMILEEYGELKWIAISKPTNINHYKNSISMRWLTVKSFADQIRLVAKTAHRPTTWDEAFVGLKAYFSSTPAVIKVGDVVIFDYHDDKLTGILAPDGDYAAYHTDGSEGSFGDHLVSNVTPTGQNISGLVTWTDTLNALKGLPKTEPDFSGSYAERQAQWIKHHGLEVGSKVRVTGPNDMLKGSSAAYHSQEELDRCGTEGKIMSIDQTCIRIRLDSGGSWNMPYTVLEPVK